MSQPYHSGYPWSIQAGTEYGPQQTKTPNLASLNQAGIGRLSSEAQFGSYFGAAWVPAAASTSTAEAISKCRQPDSMIPLSFPVRPYEQPAPTVGL